MLTTLINGEFSLKETFWKFAVCGLLFSNLMVKIFGGLLSGKLKGISIVRFYTTSSPARFETSTVLFTVLYLSCLVGIVIYCLIIAFGVWRSSDTYDKSPWLKYAARIITAFMIYATLHTVF